MKCLVTGATGLLGTNLAYALAEKGWDARLTGMHGSETRFIEALPFDYVPADITKPEEIEPLAEGCDVVFSVAGDTSFWRRNFERQRAINIDGAENVARACLKHGVKRLVHTSTVDTLGYDPEGGLLDEATGRYNYGGLGYNYGDTKLEGERRVRRYAGGALDVMVTHPGLMVGPYDYMLQIGRIFFALKEGKWPGSPCGGVSVCHVREVANAHIAAAENGKSGESYVCAGTPETNMRWVDLVQRMAKAIGTEAPKREFSRGLFVLYGRLCEFVSGFTGTAPEMDPGMARYLSSPQYFRSDKAILELGYRVPPVEDCLADALLWYRKNGFQI